MKEKVEMGMNFLMAKFPKFTFHLDRKKELQNLIDGLHEDLLQEYADYNMEGEPLEDVKNDILESVIDACQLDNCETVECVQYTADGERYHAVFAGGMSWGDMPSESYDILDRASSFHELYELCLEFAIRDCKYCV
tara:strand:+ start:449 stop:856 length:408 start_codon:yes stop_codon:yes gene_type:complete